MSIHRRDFVKFFGVSVAAAISNIAYSQSEDSSAFQSALDVQMPSPDGKYIFHVDGKIQTVHLAGGKGSLRIPGHSCTIDYLAEDGVSPVHVYIDGGTSESSFYPGFPSDGFRKDSYGNSILSGRNGKKMNLFA